VVTAQLERDGAVLVTELPPNRANRTAEFGPDRD
jgi:hypothetical protein